MVMIADRYSLAPACCMVCRQSKTPCVDLQSEDDDLAYRVTHLYLCRDCVRDLGRKITEWADVYAVPLGWHVVDDAEAKVSADELDAVRDELVRTRDELDALKALRDAFVRANSYKWIYPEDDLRRSAEYLAEPDDEDDEDDEADGGDAPRSVIAGPAAERRAAKRVPS